MCCVVGLLVERGYFQRCAVRVAPRGAIVGDTRNIYRRFRKPYMMGDFWIPFWRIAPLKEHGQRGVSGEVMEGVRKRGFWNPFLADGRA